MPSSKRELKVVVEASRRLNRSSQQAYAEAVEAHHRAMAQLGLLRRTDPRDLPRESARAAEAERALAVAADERDIAEQAARKLWAMAHPPVVSYPEPPPYVPTRPDPMRAERDGHPVDWPRLLHPIARAVLSRDAFARWCLWRYRRLG